MNSRRNFLKKCSSFALIPAIPQLPLWELNDTKNPICPADRKVYYIHNNRKFIIYRKYRFFDLTNVCAVYPSTNHHDDVRISIPFYFDSFDKMNIEEVEQKVLDQTHPLDDSNILYTYVVENKKHKWNIFVTQQAVYKWEGK